MNLNEYLRKTPRSKTHEHVKKVKELKKVIKNLITADMKKTSEDEGPRFYRISDKQIKYEIFNRRVSVKNDVPLFPRGSGPSPDDVKQGLTDLDCYLLAALSGIAKQKPEAIKKCFVDYPSDGNIEEVKKFNSLSIIKVMLFYCDDNGKIKETVIAIDKTKLRRGGALWIRSLEKAFAVYRSKGLDDSVGEHFIKKAKVPSRIISGTKGADEEVIIMAITGKPADTVFVRGPKAKKFPQEYSTKAEKNIKQ